MKIKIEKQSIRKNPAGFTIVELLLAVALITVLAGISIPLYQSFQVKNDIDIGAITIVQALKRAQLMSQSIAENSMWGVKVQSGSVVVFKGTDYASRDQSLDEIYDLSPNINISGTGDIITSGTGENTYAKMTGETQKTGTIILTSASTGESRSITVNSKGMAEY